MGLDHFFDKNLVFCLEADNQEHLFDQVATLLEEREIVTPTYREALITREKSFPTGLDMEFLGKDLPNVAIPHTDIVHNLAEKVVVVRLEKPVTFHNMIAPDKEVEVSLLFFIINNSSSSQTNILAQLMASLLEIVILKTYQKFLNQKPSMLILLKQLLNFVY